jgi:hypothetical protein
MTEGIDPSQKPCAIGRGLVPLPETHPVGMPGMGMPPISQGEAMKALILITALAAVPTLAFAAIPAPAQPVPCDSHCQMMTASSHTNPSQAEYKAQRQWDGDREGRR